MNSALLPLENGGFGTLQMNFHSFPIFVPSLIFGIRLLAQVNSPGTATAFDFGNLLFARQVHDGNIVGRSIGRVELLSIRRERDAPGPGANFDRVEHIHRLRVQHADGSASAGAHINFFAVRRCSHAHRP